MVLVIACLLACLLNVSDMLPYVRDVSARTVVRTATLRRKLRIKFAISSNKSAGTGPTSPSVGSMTAG